MMQKPLKVSKIFGIFIAVLLVILATPGYTQEQGLNFISEMKGYVEVKYNGNGNYEKIYLGDALNHSDKLRLAKGASAKVMCNNLSLWQINSPGEFPVSKGCPPTKTTIFRENITTDNTRGSNNPNIPYLISPRNTAILNGQPTLHWNPVSGATSYQVQIFSGEEFNWTNTVSQPKVVYSGNKPMQAGIYKVNISANNGASTKGNDDSVFFVMQSDDYIREVKSLVAQLQQKPLSNSSKSFALAHLYRSYDLNADAIDLLEGLVKTGNQTTAVYQLLGNIYRKIGLNELAREKYLNAMQLAEAEGNLKVKEKIQSEIDRILSNY
jgi:hypothetical protein